jgi:hypothetical protein
MDRYQALEVLMHAQFMELLAKDLLGINEDALMQQYENKAEYKMEQRPAEPAVFKPDTERLAYMHNHGYTPLQISQLRYPEKSRIGSELACKLGKTVVWS